MKYRKLFIALFFALCSSNSLLAMKKRISGSNLLAKLKRTKVGSKKRKIESKEEKEELAVEPTAPSLPGGFSPEDTPYHVFPCLNEYGEEETVHVWRTLEYNAQGESQRVTELKVVVLPTTPLPEGFSPEKTPYYVFPSPNKDGEETVHVWRRLECNDLGEQQNVTELIVIPGAKPDSKPLIRELENKAKQEENKGKEPARLTTLPSKPKPTRKPPKPPKKYRKTSDETS